MKLIIWLWNPWIMYEKTRHNVGFLFLDWFIKDLNISENFQYESKFQGEIVEYILNWEKILFLKPQTYMNLSWESVSKVIHFYKIDLANILVIYDDISLPPWNIRFRESGSAWWQNGIKNIILHIGENFKRIKIWIGQDKKWDLSDWVLSKFYEHEQDKLNNETFIEAKKLVFKHLFL
jgi:PTH1 family peptidyl-tRNA hydrolase